MNSFSHRFFQLLNFFINIKNVSRILKSGNYFKKIGISEKNFQNFLNRKIGAKIGLRGHVLSQKVRVKNFSSISQFEDRFEIFFISVGKFFVEKLV